MSPVTTTKPPKIKASENGGRPGGTGGNGFYRDGRWESSLPFDRYQVKLIGLWFFLATVTMFFAAITSALIIRRASPDWKSIYFPDVFWLTTALLLLSSVSLETSRHTLKKSWSLHKAWLGVATLLGLFFLAGQIYALMVLAAHGLFLPTNPHSSFLYLITSLHGLHLLGGIIWMLSVFVGSQKQRPVQEEEKSLKLLAVYWHFLDFLWLYLLVLLLIM